MASAPIQWLLVTFPATVAANGTATYRVVLDGSAGANPAPATPLTFAQNANQITVNTSAATFVFGGGYGALFDEIRLANNTRVVSGSAISGQVNNAAVNHSTARRIAIESSGPWSAVVAIEGAYDMTTLGSRRRYASAPSRISPSRPHRRLLPGATRSCPGSRSPA